MKKHVSTFLFTFVFSFITFAALTGLFVSTGQYTFREKLEIYLLIASGSCFLAGTNLLYSIFFNVEGTRAIGEFTQEIVHSGSLLFQASRLLFSLQFLPVWVVLVIYGVTELYLFLVLPIVGLVLASTTQFFWFLWRGRLFRYCDSKAVSVPLYTPLRIVLFTVDIIGILMAISMIEEIREYAFIQEPILLLGISLLLSFGMLAWHREGLKSVLKLDLPIFLAPLVLWIAIVIATLNFALDFSAPIFAEEISYQDCPGGNNPMFSVGGKEIHGPLPDEVYYGCRLMTKQAQVGAQSVIIIEEFRGAFGIRWLTAKRN